MVNEVNVAIGLNCDHGLISGIVEDEALVWDCVMNHHVPLTIFTTGHEIEEMEGQRGTLGYILGFDFIHEIWTERGGSIANPRCGYFGDHFGEIATTGQDFAPVVHPFGEGILNDYFCIIVDNQIKRAINNSRRVLGKVPVTMLPPDGVYAPVAAEHINCTGLSNVVISSEKFPDDEQLRHLRGRQLYAGSCPLAHIVRSNKVQLENYHNADHFLDAALHEGFKYDIPFVCVVSDSENFWHRHDYLNWIGRRAFERGIKIFNFNGVAHHNQYRMNFNHPLIESFWPWRNIYSMDTDGSLGLYASHDRRNLEVGNLVEEIARRLKSGWRWEDSRIQEAIKWAGETADSALRHRDHGDNHNFRYDNAMHNAYKTLAA